MKPQPAPLLFGLAVFILAAGMFAMSLSMDYYTRTGPGPGFFPLWGSGILGVLSILYMIVGWREKLEAGVLPKGKHALYAVSILAGVLLFMVLANWIGFLLSCAVMTFVVLCFHYRLWVAALISLAVAAILQTVFELVLSIPLPDGIFG